jgi:hypothetical protein
MFLYSAASGGFYTKDSKSYPTDAVSVSQEDYTALFEGQSRGKVIVPNGAGFPVLVDPSTPVQASHIEEVWVLNEMDRIRNEIEKVQDSDPSAIGSVSDWRTYRKAVRAWSTNKDYPNPHLRPKSPDFLEEVV